MRRTLLIVLLSIGAVGGIAAGVHSWRHHGHFGHHGPWFDRHEAFEQHVADLCVRAANRVASEAPAAAAPAP